MYLIFRKKSFNEYEDKIKITNTLSELLIYFSSIPRELAVLDYSTISSLSVLIKNYIRNRKWENKTELIL